jgi:hypothetical protein
MTALALLAALLIGGPADAQSTGSWGRTPPGDWRRSPMSPSVTVYDRDFRVGSTLGSLPDCNPDNDCELQCVAAASGVLSCTDENGAAITVTAGTGPTSVVDPYGRYALNNITAAKAPRITSANGASLEGFFANNQPWTIVMTGAGNAVSNAATSPIVNMFPSAGSDVNIRSQSGGSPTGGDFECLINTYDATASNGLGVGWAMQSCRYDGSSAMRSRSNANTTISDTSGTYTNPTGITWWFGRNNAGTVDNEGYIESFTVFSTEKSDADLQALFEDWAGLNDSADSPLDFTCAGTCGESWILVGSQYQRFGVGTPPLDGDGLILTSAAQDNNPVASGWATDPLDASSWTDVGTPTVTVNQAAGPFGDWRAGIGGSEADLIVDNDGAVGEGKTGTLGCGDVQTATGSYTASCWIRSGTSGTTTTEARIGVVTDATGTTMCPITGLTSSFQRYDCTAAITGSPTSIKGRVLVGDADADTGSIIVSQCQCENREYATMPRASSSAIVSTGWQIPAAETATWNDGTTGGLDQEVVFKFDFVWPDESPYIQMIFDVSQAADHNNHSTVMFLSSTLVDSNWHMSVATYPNTHPVDCPVEADTDTDSANQASPLAANTWYVMRFKYLPAGESGGIPRVNHYLYFDTCADPATCHATTLIGSDTTGTKCAPEDALGYAWLGRRTPGSIRPMDGRIARITVKNVKR